MVCLATACAPKALVLPTGAGTPFPEFPEAYQQATAACGGVKTMTASMAMSGKAGTTKLRGRIDAGFAAPARARLEGVHPVFGKPVFILVADGGRGTLVLPREDRVLRDAPPDRIVEALAGVPLGPDALRTAISGCGFGSRRARGRAHVRERLGSGFVRRIDDLLRRSAAAWEVAAATAGPVYRHLRRLRVGPPGDDPHPRRVATRRPADVTLRLSDVDINTTLDPRTFRSRCSRITRCR